MFEAIDNYVTEQTVSSEDYDKNYDEKFSKLNFDDETQLRI